MNKVRNKCMKKERGGDCPSRMVRDGFAATVTVKETCRKQENRSRRITAERERERDMRGREREREREQIGLAA
jgi:hypothetical protein